MALHRRTPTVVLVLFAALVLFAHASCDPGRAWQAKALLEEIAAGGPTARDAAAITRETIAFTVVDGADERGYGADLYTAEEDQAAPLVLVPGADPAGKDHPQLVAFAAALARAGFQVLVPDIENLRALKVSAVDAVAIADALGELSARQMSGAGEPPPKVGLVAISYAAGPAVIAALEPGVRDRLAFMMLIGGYYDSTALVTFFTTGHYRLGEDEPWLTGEPNVYGKWVFAQSNVQHLSEGRDRILMREIARRKRNDPSADLARLAGRMGPEGLSVLALLENRDPARVPALIADLPPGLREEIAALDLARRDLGGLAAELILLHGRDDPIIPYSESLALAQAAPRSLARLYLVDNLAHVDLGPGGLDDLLTLWRAAYRLLSARNRLMEAAAKGGIEAASRIRELPLAPQSANLAARKTRTGPRRRGFAAKV